MVRTYAEAGVDIDAKGAQVRALVDQLRFYRRGVGAPWGPKGHFAGFVDMGRTALGMCTDSVGTKVLVANEMRRWDTVGVDCVAANVNDMVCAGAEPIAFVDYIAVDSQDPELPRQVGVGADADLRPSRPRHDPEDEGLRAREHHGRRTAEPRPSEPEGGVPDHGPAPRPPGVPRDPIARRDRRPGDVRDVQHGDGLRSDRA